MARIALLCITAAVAAACAARRAAAPPRPQPEAARSDLRHINFYVDAFGVSGLGSEESPRDRERLEERFLDYLEAHAALSSIYVERRAEIPTPALGLDVRVELDQTTYRTYILDALAAVPYIFGLLTPWWGHVDVRVEVDVLDVDRQLLGTYAHAARADFHNILYSWFRRRFVENAYRSAYAAAFDEVARQIAADARRLRSAAFAQPGAEAALAEAARPQSDELARTEDIAVPPAGDPGLPEPSAPEADTPPTDALGEYDYVVPPELLAGSPPKRRFGIITESTTPAFDGTLYGALRLLGGIEVAGFYGIAAVSSGITDEAGVKQEIASGAAQQIGWRVALYGAPSSTGFFAYPAIGFMQQRIDIADFRAALPHAEPQGGRDIAARCSDPDSGEPIDCGAPNVYRLDLSSFYAGARAGYDLVLGSASFLLFGSLSGGTNLVEHRTVRARIAQYSAEEGSWNGLRSFALGGTLGFALPDLHWALRLIADYELYRRFEYAEALEFQGPVTWSDERNTYIRPRLFVRDARLSTWSFQLATALVF